MKLWDAYPRRLVEAVVSPLMPPGPYKSQRPSACPNTRGPSRGRLRCDRLSVNKTNGPLVQLIHSADQRDRLAFQTLLAFRDFRQLAHRPPHIGFNSPMDSLRPLEGGGDIREALRQRRPILDPADDRRLQGRRGGAPAPSPAPAVSALPPEFMDLMRKIGRAHV